MTLEQGSAAEAQNDPQKRHDEAKLRKQIESAQLADDVHDCGDQNQGSSGPGWLADAGQSHHGGTTASIARHGNEETVTVFLLPAPARDQLPQRFPKGDNGDQHGDHHQEADADGARAIGDRGGHRRHTLRRCLHSACTIWEEIIGACCVVFARCGAARTAGFRTRVHFQQEIRTVESKQAGNSARNAREVQIGPLPLQLLA